MLQKQHLCVAILEENSSMYSIFPLFLFETFLLASFKEVVQAHLVTPFDCADALGEGLVSYS